MQTSPDPCSFQAYKARQRFANLDGLRFFCILMVLWHHTPRDGVTGRLFERGFFGVDFFFVLSGFLITTLLLREAEVRGTFSLRQFYLRRVLRIVPVYFFVITMVCLYYVGVKGQTDLLDLVPFYYLFLSNFLVEHIPTLSPTWSLSVEEQFYLIWPVLLLLLPARLIVPVALVLVAVNVAGVMGAFGVAAPQWGPLTFALPDATYAPLIIGALLACLLHRQQTYGLLAGPLRGRWTVLALAACLLLCLATFPADTRGLPNLGIHLVMGAIIAALVVREDSAGSGVLQSPLVARIGVVSYGIYLYHLLVLDVVNRVTSALGVPYDWVVFGLYSVLSYLVAEASFRTLEAYFQRFRPRSAARQPV